MGEKGSYVVVIPYREPTYELRRGEARKAPYQARYQVEAASPEEAIECAVRRFKQTARESSVAWVREIERDGIRVELGA